KSFITCKLGMYDLGTTLNLEWDKYKDFVSQLFEYDTKEIQSSGVKFDGEKRGFPVRVFDYIEHKESAVDYNYINEIHKNIKYTENINKKKKLKKKKKTKDIVGYILLHLRQE